MDGSLDSRKNGQNFSESLRRAREGARVSAIFTHLTKEVRKMPSLGSITEQSTTITIPLIPPASPSLSISLQDASLTTTSENTMVVDLWKGMVALYTASDQDKSSQTPIIATTVTLLRHGSRRTHVHSFLNLLVDNLGRYSTSHLSPSLITTKIADTVVRDELIDSYDVSFFGTTASVSVTSSVLAPDRAKYAVLSTTASFQTYSFDSLRESLILLVRESLVLQLTLPASSSTGEVIGRVMKRVGEDRVLVVGSDVCVAITVSLEGRIMIQKVPQGVTRHSNGTIGREKINGKVEEEGKWTNIDPVATNIMDAIMQLK